MGKYFEVMGQQPIVFSDCCRIKLTSENTFAKYPAELRKVDAGVQVNGVPHEMSFITNNMEWSPYSVCELYAACWGIEVFFKEIKQTLQLADFLGTSENAIKWQIWTALLVRFIGWLNESFRRLYTLVKGLLWSRRTISEILKLILSEDKSRPPPVKWTAVQLQFDFGDAFAQN